MWNILTLILEMKNSGARRFLWKAHCCPLTLRMPWPNIGFNVLVRYEGLPRSRDLHRFTSFINSAFPTYKCCLVPVEYMNIEPDNQNIKRLTRRKQNHTYMVTCHEIYNSQVKRKEKKTKFMQIRWRWRLWFMVGHPSWVGPGLRTPCS